MRPAFAIVVLLALGCSGKPESKEALRREMLTPPDRAKQRAEYEQRVALADDEGNLLESDEKAAELTLPRGLDLVERKGNVWRYETKRVTLAQLDRYFAVRLFTGKIDRRVTGAVTYAHAQIKAAPKAPLIDLSLTPRDKHGRHVDLRIGQYGHRTGPSRLPSFEESRALLEQRRKYLQ